MILRRSLGPLEAGTLDILRRERPLCISGGHSFDSTQRWPSANLAVSDHEGWATRIAKANCPTLTHLIRLQHRSVSKQEGIEVITLWVTWTETIMKYHYASCVCVCESYDWLTMEDICEVYFSEDKIKMPSELVLCNLFGVSGVLLPEDSRRALDGLCCECCLS